MRRLIKIFAVTGLALAVVGVTSPKAEAHGGWPIAAGVFGGLALGTYIGATVAHAAPPYYVYAPPRYAYATAYAAPVPQVVVQPQVVAPLVCAAPAVYPAPYPYYYRGYYGPVVRVGFGWGPRYHHYRR